MPNRPPHEPENGSRNQRRRRKKPRKPRGLGSILLFWPFYLVNALTAGLSTPSRWAARALIQPAVLALYLFIPASLFYYARARQFDMAAVAAMPERSVVLDRRGEELGRIHGEKRDIVTTDKIATEFLMAILAREDERFYRHRGVDWIGFGRAMLRNLKDRSFTQGASTLTMQLARNSYHLQAPWLGFSNAIQEVDRKFLELAVSYRIEASYSKDEILQHYVNRIFWGHTIRGIEEASRTYFEKRARDLTLSESALLAGIVRGPNAFSPFKDLSDAQRERDATLDRMVDAELLSEEEATAAKADPIKVRPEWRRIFHDSWAMDAVRRELERILEDEDIEFGGLQITTTIDHLIQKKAEEALDQHLRGVERGSGYPHQTRAEWLELAEPRPAPKYVQGSVVVIENLTGAIVATVGGRNADESKFNRASQAKRQVGSTFKPFVYLAAFDQGLRPDTLISDDPIPGSWSPKNSDGKFNGFQSVSYGLVRSRNTMTVRVGQYAGIDHVADVTRAVGYENPLDRNPTAYLGTLEASPEEVASAYTVFPNRGIRYAPHLIKEIRDREGNVRYQNPQLSYQAVKSGSAYQVARILNEVNERGTGASVKRLGFTKPSGGKTGTTNDYKDAWYVGFTSSLTCAVWVGLDNPAKIVDRGYGSTLSLPVWTEVMKTADRLGYAATGLDSQLSFIECRLCRETGKRATSGCEAEELAYTDSVPIDLVPSENDVCPVHGGTPIQEDRPAPRAIPIDPETLGPATDDEAQLDPTPLRAIPVPEPAPAPARRAPAPPRAQPVPQPRQAPPPPPRAQPVPRALPVEEVPRALPVEEPPPRALPVD